MDAEKHKSKHVLKLHPMKKSIYLFTFIFSMFFALQSFAQVKFGPKVGLNLSKMTLKSSGFSLDPKIIVGFHIGGIAEIPLANNFYLQPGILYSGKGTKFSISGDGMSSDMTIKPGFIEVPVNAMYKFDMSPAKLFLFAGPYFAFGIGGKSESGGESTDIKFGSGSDNDMKAFDLGLNIGAGVDIKNFLISAQYGFGLTNLAPVTDNDAEMKISVIGFSVAYLFGGK